MAQIEEWLEREEVFARARTPTDKRAVAISAYHGGLSLARAGELVGRSAEAVREWYGKAAGFFRALPPACRTRIAVDEKVLHLPGGQAYLWAAVDIDTEEPLAFQVTRTRDILDAHRFMAKARKTCRGRRPRVFVDGGRWYTWAIKATGFGRSTVICFGPRSAIERLNSLIDRRLRPFYEYFLPNATPQSVEQWVEAFAGIYIMRQRLRAA